MGCSGRFEGSHSGGNGRTERVSLKGSPLGAVFLEVVLCFSSQLPVGWTFFSARRLDWFRIGYLGLRCR